MSTAPADEIGRNDYRILGLIGVGHGMSHFYYMVLPPLFPYLKDAYNVSYAELGLMLALMSAASAIVQVPIGFLVDRYGARLMLTGGLITVAAAIALMSIAPTFWVLVLLAFIAGVGNAVFHPADYAILNASISAGRMGRAFSIHTFTGQIGTAAAPVVMILLLSWLGWRMALVVAGLIGLVALIGLVSQWDAMREDVLKTSTKPGKEEAGSAEGGAVKESLSLLLSRPMILFFVFFTTLSMMQTGLQSFTVTALVDLHGVSLAAAGTALSVYLFASAAGVLVGGEVSDRTSRHDLVAAAVFVLSAVFCVAFAWIDMPVAVLLALMAIMGVGQGMTRPARDMMLRAAAPKGQTGSVFGFVTSGIAVGSALAPIPFGWLIDIGRPAWVFYLLAAFMVVTLLTVLMPKETSGKAGSEAKA